MVLAMAESSVCPPGVNRQYCHTLRPARGHRAVKGRVIAQIGGGDFYTDAQGQPSAARSCLPWRLLRR